MGSFIGLTPAKDQSGESDPQKRISKAGEPFLRRLLVQCAHHMLGHFGEDSDLRHWGLRLAERGGKAAARSPVIGMVLRRHSGQRTSPAALKPMTVKGRRGLVALWVVISRLLGLVGIERREGGDVELGWVVVTAERAGDVLELDVAEDGYNAALAPAVVRPAGGASVRFDMDSYSLCEAGRRTRGVHLRHRKGHRWPRLGDGPGGFR
jgi:hypothetical protein